MDYKLEKIKLDLKVDWKISRNSSTFKENFILSRGDYASEIAPNIRYQEDTKLIESHFKELGKAKEPVRKEYLFNFKEGGWNSVYAFNKTQAIKYAKETWSDFKDLTVDVKSFRRSTPTESKQLMSNFY